MKGLIIGDIIGSPYEFTQIKDRNLPFKTRSSKFTDDTIMAIATMDWLLNNPKKSFEKTLRKWCSKYPQPMGGYGANFSKWIKDSNMGPYDSFGNGSAVRSMPLIRYIIKKYDNSKYLEQALLWGKKSAEITHDHIEGIKGSQAVIYAGILASKKYPKIHIRKEIENVFGYDLSFDFIERSKTYKYNESCQECVPEAIVAFLKARSFNESIQNCLSLGGDADSLCAISGGLAESYYGLPKSLWTWAEKKLDPDMKLILNQFYHETSK